MAERFVVPSLAQRANSSYVAPRGQGNFCVDDEVRDANNLISQARTWQRHNAGDTPGFGGDHERALGSIKARVLYMPGETMPIPSLWGHSAGSGGNAADNTFINDQVKAFLEDR